ncbi:DJ-1 family protein [Escherichia coli]|nr:DJ-1 family protein [Escherichia coli]
MSASALVCLAPGSEETEAVTTIDLLVRGGIKVTTASVASDGNLAITCSRGVKLLADAPLVEVADGEYDVIVLPGGIKGAECFRDRTLLVETVKQFHRAGTARYLPDWQYDRLPDAERQNSRRTMAGQARRLGCTGKIADQPGAGYGY